MWKNGYGGNVNTVNEGEWMVFQTEVNGEEATHKYTVLNSYYIFSLEGEKYGLKNALNISYC